jgi:LPXTG-motif cell wall-anchored protein
MSTLNKTGLRVAAAGAAAALTLAVGAPAFAQDETEPAEATTPATDATTEPETGTETEPEQAESETATEEAATEEAGDDEVIENEEDLGEEIEEDTEEEAEEENYFEFAYLDQVFEGADKGETVTPDPQFQAWGTAPEDTVASLVWFTDAVDFEKWVGEEDWESEEDLSDNSVTVLDEYENCAKDGLYLVCIVDGWAFEDGKIYGPSEASPVNYTVEGEISEFGMSVYGGYELNQEDYDLYTEYLGIDLESGSQFALAELGEGDAAPADEFVAVEGWIFFEASFEDVPHPNVPGGGDPQLPTTGNSSIILISSAAAALLAGAVVFFMLRRRKAATTWE